MYPFRRRRPSAGNSFCSINDNDFSVRLRDSNPPKFDVEGEYFFLCSHHSPEQLKGVRLIVLVRLSGPNHPPLRVVPRHLW